MQIFRAVAIDAGLPRLNRDSDNEVEAANDFILGKDQMIPENTVLAYQKGFF